MLLNHSCFEWPLPDSSFFLWLNHTLRASLFLETQPSRRYSALLFGCSSPETNHNCLKECRPGNEPLLPVHGSYTAQSSLLPSPASLCCFSIHSFALHPSSTCVCTDSSSLTVQAHVSNQLLRASKLQTESPEVNPSPLRFLPPSLIHDPHW